MITSFQNEKKSLALKWKNRVFSMSVMVLVPVFINQLPPVYFVKNQFYIIKNNRKLLVLKNVKNNTFFAKAMK